jgi:hypothetical protein
MERGLIVKRDFNTLEKSAVTISSSQMPFDSGSCRRSNAPDHRPRLTTWWETRAWFANYDDDNARVMLATMVSAYLLHEIKWDAPMTMCLLGKKPASTVHLDQKIFLTASGKIDDVVNGSLFYFLHLFHSKNTLGG